MMGEPDVIIISFFTGIRPLLPLIFAGKTKTFA
jgi:hypothetical protein